MGWSLSDSERANKRAQILSQLSGSHKGVDKTKLKSKTKDFESKAYAAARSRADYDSRISSSIAGMGSRCPFAR